ncbi:cytochrome c3 family protein [Bacillaceae bacterium IKA-2]|nr:cytochrome c3 family protein [Bacillaceae bacterium IKA-2]
MKKLSFSLLFIFLVAGILATTAMAGTNANNTGLEPMMKTLGMYTNDGVGPEDQKLHGSYQNNTNSCASCHQTHAGSARQMLFTESSAVCASCHDGTLGFYDVAKTGKAYFNSSSTAGTFGGTDEGNASAHAVGGSVNHSAAPGGKLNGTEGPSWGASFSCSSCHAPHGSHSDRLLHYNPNNMANTAVVDGGKKQMNIPIVAGAGTGHHIRIDGTTMRLYNGNNLVTTPWLNTGFNFRINGQATGNSNSLVTVDFRNATATVNSGDFVGGTADIPVTYAVKLAKDASYVSPVSNVDWKHDAPATMNNATDTGNYSDFCASCHTDYVKGRGLSTFETVTNADGIEVPAPLYGHTARNGSNGGRSCIGCHFAHGNDVDIMLDAQGRTVFDLEMEKDWSLDLARNYMKDNNPSSALKKYTNMTSCFACHNSSRSSNFVNQTPSEEQPTGWSNTNDPSRKTYE